LIEKNLDMTLVGKNYLSFLLGVELLDRNQKVLLLDDDRLSYGQLYSDSLPQLEVDFLKTWGEDRGLEPFLHLDKYLKNRHLTFVIGDNLIRLGGRPSHNFSEILRKLSNMLPAGLEIGWPYETLEGQKEFDDAFHAFSKRIAQNAFRYKSVQSFNTAVFLAHCPPDIKKCFESFEEVFRNLSLDPYEGQNSELTFFFMARGKFQKKFSMELSRFELFHLFLTLLSPLYELDQDSLLMDLEPVLIERGGLYKRTRIREWLFHKSKPWSLELASYDGIIHPKNISLLGADPSGLSIKLENLGQSFGCIRVSFDFASDAKIFWENEKFLRCDKSMLGTERPLWEADFGEEKVLFKVFVKKLKGSKIEFHEKEILKMLKIDMTQIFPGLWEKLEEPTLDWGPEIWIEGEGSKTKGDIPFPKSVMVTNVKEPMSHERLNQVYYFGPYKEGPLGLLSSLMEIKDGQQFL
tara:strand:+ start:33236 stop:34627 length:1392 start_codon:yes stop_codon:yes gene_type:complete